uniref:HAT C-terminal dimerisation domain-containing protein n=1 Tax=Lactuca sativa TaxID=4236 RepID=A0A9R1WQ06_LACSA|nr:hypothetical protein LSAT_V11C900498770 [Lactuca sativa]
MCDLIVQTDYPLVSMEMELTRYLNEQSIKYIKYFDILLWWKQNTSRYPIVSHMTREAVFSTIRPILVPYRTNLSANIVEDFV